MGVGSGSMLPPPALLAPPPGGTGTKYEMHFCAQATEIVLLFERGGLGAEHATVPPEAPLHMQHAADGDAALIVARNIKPDLIVLDLRLPV